MREMTGFDVAQVLDLLMKLENSLPQTVKDLGHMVQKDNDQHLVYDEREQKTYDNVPDNIKERPHGQRFQS